MNRCRSEYHPCSGDEPPRETLRSRWAVQSPPSAATPGTLHCANPGLQRLSPRRRRRQCASQRTCKCVQRRRPSSNVRRGPQPPSRAISFSARAQTSSKLQESRLKDLRKGTEKLFILAEWQNVLQIFTGKSWLLSFRLILNDFLKVRRSCHFRRAIHRNQHHQNVLPFDPAGRDIWQSALPPHLSTTIGWIGCYCRLPKR